MSNFISSYLQIKIFCAVIILLNITHVLNISFCSSMFIKSNTEIYNWADIIKNYKTCLCHPEKKCSSGREGRKKEKEGRKKKKKNVHLKMGISNSAFVLNLLYIFCHSTSESWFLHLNHRFRLQTYVLFFSLSKSSGCSGNVLTYSLALQPSDSPGPLTLITD